MPEPVKRRNEPAGPARPRGRPPSARVRAAILRAARELLDEGGLTAVTMDGIAARARVGKPTIYRHWASRYEVAMAALIEAVPVAAAAVATTGAGASPLERIRTQLRQVAGIFTTRLGRNVAAVLAAAYGETDVSKAFRSHFVQARRDEGRALLAQAAAVGEVRPGLDAEVALDLIYGPVFYRLTMGHAPLDAAFVDRLLDDALAGLGPRTPGG